MYTQALQARKKKEAKLKVNPLAARADRRQREALHEAMIERMHHINGELSPADIQKRLQVPACPSACLL